VTPEPSSSRMWLLACTVAYLALGCVLGVALYQVTHSRIFVEETAIESESADPADTQPLVLDGRIDPNTAQWHELTALPRVGEALARRIVAYREAKIKEWRSAHPDEPIEHAPPVFVTPDDLLAVQGIGPKTLELLQPHLRWPEEAAASQVAP
jgi:DNA uptake protein ComE-like DNA-binding protein